MKTNDYPTMTLKQIEDTCNKKHLVSIFNDAITCGSIHLCPVLLPSRKETDYYMFTVYETPASPSCTMLVERTPLALKLMLDSLNLKFNGMLWTCHI